MALWYAASRTSHDTERYSCWCKDRRACWVIVRQATDCPAPSTSCCELPEPRLTDTQPARWRWGTDCRCRALQLRVFTYKLHVFTYNCKFAADDISKLPNIAWPDVTEYLTKLFLCSVWSCYNKKAQRWPARMSGWRRARWHSSLRHRKSAMFNSTEDKRLKINDGDGGETTGCRAQTWGKHDKNHVHDDETAYQ